MSFSFPGIRAPAQQAPVMVSDLATRRRMLDMMAQQYVSEIAAVVIPGVLVLFHLRSADPLPLGIWWVCFMALAGMLMRMQLRFRAQSGHLPDEVLVPRWEPAFERLAVAYGVAWSLPIFITLHSASYEFKLLLYLSLCAVTASAATYLAPLPGVFLRFFVCCFGPLTVAVFWVFPDHWYYLLPLCLLYGLVVCRHAAGTRHFVLQQVALEQRAAALARQYQATQERAEWALSEKSRFLSTASHDLRQPVHALGMLTEAAALRNVDPQMQPLLQDMRGCVRSLTLMFDALLDLSRLEDGSFATYPADVAVRTVFDEVATVFGPDAAHRGLALRFRLPRRRHAVVHGDPALLRQMVFNLTQNALRYTRAGGVLLGVRRRGGRWRIEVWDTGSGVAVADRDRLYTPFFRGGLPGRPTAGYGLGLAVVARTAELSDVHYGFESTPARGSCFWLDVAAAVRDDAALVRPAEPLRSRAGTLSGHCLLVEDDPQVAAAWSSLMEGWGVTTRVAESGRQAFAYLDEGFVPAAILSDQNLASGERGYALLQALLQRCPQACGAMVSGEHAAADLLEAEEAGYLVFRKPMDPDQLYAVLTRWLSARSPAAQPGGTPDAHGR